MMWDGYGFRYRTDATQSHPSQEQAAIDRLKLTLESPHLDWYDREQIEQRLEVAVCEARRSAIMSSIWAMDQRALAQHLADNASIPTEDAVAMLELVHKSSRASSKATEACGSHALALGGVMSRADAALLGGGHSSWSSLAAETFADRKKQTKGNSK
jgi:hypothetical protein